MFKVFIKRSVAWALVGLAVALVVSFLAPQQYEAQVVLMVGEPLRQGGDNTLSPEVASLIQRNATGNAPTELDLLRSRPIFAAALQTAVPNFSLADFEEYYNKFNVVASVADNPNQQSSIAIISARAPTKDIARQVVEAVRDEYDQERAKMLTSTYELAINRVKAQMDGAKAELDAANAELMKYMKANEVTSPEAQNTQLINYRQTLEATLEKARADLATNNAQLAAARMKYRISKDMMEGSTTELRSVELVEAEANLTRLRTARARLLERYLDDHPEVKEIDAQIRASEAELKKGRSRGMVTNSGTNLPNDAKLTLEKQIQALEIGRDGLLSNIATVQAQLDAQNARVAKIPDTSVGMDEHSRKRQILSNKVSVLTANITELESRISSIPLKTQMIGNGAFVGDKPVEPNFVRNILLGLLAGLSLGLLYSFAVESMNPRVYSAGQVQQFTGLPVSATLPDLRALGPRMMRSLSTPGGRPAESFRYLASATLAAGEVRPRLVVFTGIGRRSGTTVSALQYAVAMSQTGLSVLLIDSDAKRRLTKLLGKETEAGLSDALETGPASAQPTSTMHNNLSFLPFGRNERRPSEFPVDQLEGLITALEGKYDMIVVDCPPCDVLADASRFARHADETMVVFSAQRSSLLKIPTVAQLLQNAGAKNVSLVMTNSADQSEPFLSADTVSASRPLPPPQKAA